MSLAQIYISGEVRRWHCNPVMARTGQTLADHQGRCGQLLLALYPNASSALIYYVLHHDVGELLAGDLAGDFKAANPEVAAAHAAVEAQLCAQILRGPLPYLTPREADWAKLVDKLEATLFTLFNALPEYHRPASGWVAAEAELLNRASALGCRDVVEKLIDDITAGVF